MEAGFQKDLYEKVEEISADVAALKSISANILAVQKKQEIALKTISSCLEKITEVITDYFRILETSTLSEESTLLSVASVRVIK